jgi:hypothetical protein
MRFVIGTIIRLLLLCLVVGLLLAFFNITPSRIFTDTAVTIRQVYELGIDFVGWAESYVTLGAVIVVPIAVVALLMRLARW